ncbi:MAG TPA: redoxin domain-containing protein, partial [Armatimonadota bacterium]|nr:redoxin domain-containing protein [Armatimonadota bacterium]
MHGRRLEIKGRATRANRGAMVTGVAATLLLAGLIGIKAAPGVARRAPAVGQKVAELRLKDADGKVRTLDEFKERKALVLVFTGTRCPISNNYVEPLSTLHTRYSARGVQFLAINANPDEDSAAVATHAREYRFTFPVLKDENQALASRVGARVTPEAFVLDENRVVRYRGRIDSQYASRTQKRRHVGSRDLESALDAVLAGKPVATPVTQAFGCAIVLSDKAAAAAQPVTYHKDVAPILQAHCQSCHRPGQVAPFSLLTYTDAKKWAGEIKEFTHKRIMPPWKAEPGHGEFMDVRRMSDDEVGKLAAWADAGSPEGDPKQAAAPREWPQDWMLGKPDLVLTMPEQFSVEATGEDVFRCFVLPTNLTENKQVVAVEIRPGNPRVLHHVLNFIDTTGKARQLDEKDPGPGYNSGPGGVGFFPSGALGGWAPGNMPRFLPTGLYRPLPKGSDLVMQVHYHKTGKPEVDRTSIGVYFAKEPVKKQVRTLPLTNLAIDIPPGAARHEVKAGITVPFDAEAIAITPHMHLLGREMKVTATLPDGSVKNMVLIKDWDYRWQDTYIYK